MRTVKGAIGRAVAARRPRAMVVLVSIAVTVGVGSGGMVRGGARGLGAIVTPMVRVEIGHGVAVSCRVEFGPPTPAPTMW